MQQHQGTINYFYIEQFLKGNFMQTFLLTHSVAVTINELEMTDFPPLKLTETSRVLKENEETVLKIKIRGL